MNLVKKFLEKEILISPSLYKEIRKKDKEELKKFLSETPNEVLFLSKNEMLGEDPERKNLKIIKTNKPTSEKIKVEDIVKIFNKKFVFLKNILEEKMENIISINKIPNFDEIKAIGMVRKINEKIILEDQTGSIKISFENNPPKDIVEDEVIGVEGKSRRGLLKVDKISYPDIPLKKQIQSLRTNEKILFSSDLHLENGTKKLERIEDLIRNKRINYWFITGNISSSGYEEFFSLVKSLNIKGIVIPGDIDNNKELKRIESLNSNIRVSFSPTLSLIKNKIKVLQFDGKELESFREKTRLESSKEITISLLRKRHLCPFKIQTTLEDPYLIREIPDFLHCGCLNDFSFFNYKGVSVINTSPGKSIIVNLKNREIKEVNLM